MKCKRSRLLIKIKWNPLKLLWYSIAITFWMTNRTERIFIWLKLKRKYVVTCEPRNFSAKPLGHMPKQHTYNARLSRVQAKFQTYRAINNQHKPNTFAIVSSVHTSMETILKCSCEFKRANINHSTSTCVAIFFPYSNFMNS